MTPEHAGSFGHGIGKLLNVQPRLLVQAQPIPTDNQDGCKQTPKPYFFTKSSAWPIAFRSAATATL